MHINRFHNVMEKICRFSCELARIFLTSLHFACNYFCLPALSESSKCSFCSDMLKHPYLCTHWNKKKLSPQVQLLCWSLVFWALLQANSWIDVLFNNTSMSTGFSLQAQEAFSPLPLWPVCSRSCGVTSALFKHAGARREDCPCIYLIPFGLWLKALAPIGLDVLPAWRPLELHAC